MAGRGDTGGTKSGSNVVTRSAFNLSRTLSQQHGTGTLEGETSEERKKRVGIEKQKLKDLEAEVMGSSKRGVTSMSDIKERNLSQMISVLHTRLASLEKTTSARMELVQEDVRTDSTKSSSDGLKAGDDLEEMLKNDAGGKGVGTSKGVGHGGNLVTWMEGIHLDPHHLTLKTKQNTETAKNLEGRLEDAFGTSNTRDFRGQKKSGGGAANNARKHEQARFEQKKQMRLKLEKMLQTNMESFVTRSVLDPELIFTAPTQPEAEGLADWPIPVKWGKNDSRSSRPNNEEGEMVPILLLKLSLERTQLPSHELLFRWVIAQTCTQSFLVNMFWLMKIKFFQNEHSEDNEVFLMRELSNDYAVIIASIAQRTYSEDEKDHVYKYLPFVISSAINFGFYFLCPGSRHLYTKGFRKTILMQVVQCTAGMQLCPVTVKVSWGQLFPEEVHEDEEGAERTESVPMQSVLTAGKEAAKAKTIRGKQALEVPQYILDVQKKAHDDAAAAVPVYSLEERLSQTLHAEHERQRREQQEAVQERQRTKRRGGRLMDGDDDMEGTEMMMHGRPSTEGGELPGGASTDFLPPLPNAGKVPSVQTEGAGIATNGGLRHRAASATSLGADTALGSTNDLGMSTGGLRPLTADDKKRAGTAGKKTTNPLPDFEDPLTRTYLKAPKTRPGKHFVTPRQNVEKYNAQSVSPLVQQLLNWEDAAGRKTQPMFRTVPINWCPAGGSDTHHKRTVKKDLHDSMAKKAAASLKEFTHENAAGHRRRLATGRLVDKKRAIMMSGPQSRISQYALDLIKSHRAKDRGGKGGTDDDIPEEIDLNAAFYNDDDLDAFLEEFD
jgi:hypothetical protein